MITRIPIEITFDQTKSLVISKTTGKTIENNSGKGNKVLFQKDSKLLNIKYLYNICLSTIISYLS